MTEDIKKMLGLPEEAESILITSLKKLSEDDGQGNSIEIENEWMAQRFVEAGLSDADKILNNTKIFLQQDNTRINKESDDSYYILYKASVPSVMVECGFMSNPEEEEKLESDSYQKQLACVIALGINQYINEE